MPSVHTDLDPLAERVATTLKCSGFADIMSKMFWCGSTTLSKMKELLLISSLKICPSELLNNYWIKNKSQIIEIHREAFQRRLLEFGQCHPPPSCRTPVRYVYLCYRAKISLTQNIQLGLKPLPPV